MAGLLDNVDKAILVLNLSDPEDLHIISSPITTVAKRTRSRLLIILLHPLFGTGFGTSTWNIIQRLLAHAYIQATAVSHEMNNVLMNIEVILRPPRVSLKDMPVDSWNALFHSDDELRFLLPEKISTLPSFCVMEESSVAEINVITKSSTLPVVALGGTFDHLHSGHKILLSMAAWIAEKKDLIESLDERMNAVLNFLTLFKPGVEYNLVPIVDVYGPTATDPDIQALVVSKETLSGASSNLDVDNMELLRKAKLSSTYVRQWILKQRGGGEGI
ncbi:hypothetical protein Clacol_006811 [Clathrus columnatus]|uniref:Cytidyltransferase-like domain-containing protein n=1 Tax=Clathrus columnatus TaxID=1419009 RepID=A0AAV5AIQ1_9AGAM|nr:hypothetical protein Clacol_006811 [Clathrus columnatus]